MNLEVSLMNRSGNKSITIVTGKKSCPVVDMYSWIQGTDHHPHKIGFRDGLPIVEKINDSVYLLLDSDKTHYSNTFHNKGWK